MKYYDKLIFDLSKAGRQGYSLPVNRWEQSVSELPAGLQRAEAPALPEVSELDVVRHYTNLSQMNFGVDSGFYPLGSCTMKYNPKINEEMAALPGFVALHPHQPASTSQGALALYYNVQKSLSEIAGLHEFTLNPFAGAHGELTGLMVIRTYHEKRGDLKRTKIIVPDSAHGTNPASAAVCAYPKVRSRRRWKSSCGQSFLRRRAPISAIASSYSAVIAAPPEIPNVMAVLWRSIATRSTRHNGIHPSLSA